MDHSHPSARERFFTAVRVLATSPDSMQVRLRDSSTSILLVTMDEFEDYPELRIKFARILDALAVDRDDDQLSARETAYMTDVEAVAAAHLICDFYYDLDD